MTRPNYDLLSYATEATIYSEILFIMKCFYQGRTFLLDFFSSQGLNLHTMLSVHDKDNP